MEVCAMSLVRVCLHSFRVWFEELHWWSSSSVWTFWPEYWHFAAVCGDEGLCHVQPLPTFGMTESHAAFALWSWSQLIVQSHPWILPQLYRIAGCTRWWNLWHYWTIVAEILIEIDIAFFHLFCHMMTCLRHVLWSKILLPVSVLLIIWHLWGCALLPVSWMAAGYFDVK